MSGPHSAWWEISRNFYEFWEAKWTQRGHTWFGPRANMLRKPKIVRAPSKHVPKTDVETRFPLKETWFPLNETWFPLKETCFPLKETWFSPKETWFRLGKTLFSIKETCFPLSKIVKKTHTCASDMDFVTETRFSLKETWFMDLVENSKNHEKSGKKNVGVEKNKRDKWSEFAQKQLSSGFVEAAEIIWKVTAPPWSPSAAWKRASVFRRTKLLQKVLACRKINFRVPKIWQKNSSIFRHTKINFSATKILYPIKVHTVWAVYNTYSL